MITHQSFLNIPYQIRENFSKIFFSVPKILFREEKKKLQSNSGLNTKTTKTSEISPKSDNAHKNCAVLE